MHALYQLQAYTTNHPEVIISVDYGTNNATVFLEWIPKSHTYYNVSAEPQLEVNVTSLLSNAQLTVQYNTHYNVSIMATLCGQYTSATTIEIHYGESSISFNDYLYNICLAITANIRQF